MDECYTLILEQIGSTGRKYAFLQVVYFGLLKRLPPLVRYVLLHIFLAGVIRILSSSLWCYFYFR